MRQQPGDERRCGYRHGLARHQLRLRLRFPARPFERERFPLFRRGTGDRPLRGRSSDCGTGGAIGLAIVGNNSNFMKNTDPIRAF
jgi:hypothetical protein